MIESVPPRAAALLQLITERQARVCVVGLGYAGLPLVEAFLAAGFAVIGYDKDSARIESLRQGVGYIVGFSAEKVRAFLATGRFQATADPRALADADAVLLSVPTPLTESRAPDLSFIRAATATVAEQLRPGRLVVLTSTTYPGTTRDVVRPILEKRGLALGRDLFLAYSPEREDPGSRTHAFAHIPRLVGGVDPVSWQVACALFAAAVKQVVPVSSAEVAEAAKLLENTYRAVNIALVNELKLVCERIDLDVWEVIEAAKTKPFGFQAFYPGPGWGGHCIPINPFYLAWLGRHRGQPMRLVEIAGEINSEMTAHVARKVADALNEHGHALTGGRVCVLGVAYKPDIDDVRESPGRLLLELFAQAGAMVSYHDPYVSRLRLRQPDVELESAELTEAFLRAQDCVVIATNHSAYDWEWIVANAALLLDTRNATRNVTRFRERIRRA